MGEDPRDFRNAIASLAQDNVRGLKRCLTGKGR